ncbi:MAG: SDR family NAD(P)-dependent oxidoreductase [Sphingorhabdus sp.]
MAASFETKTVIITGAASGLGAECARRFAADGAQLVLVDVNADALDAFAATFLNAISIVGSVAEETVADEAATAAIQSWGSIDILVNNAAIDPLSAKSVSGTSADDWDRVMAVNLRGAFLFSRAVLPQMIAQKGGALVHTSSISGQRPTPNEAAYSVAKAAVLQLSRSIALDYARHGIRSNAVCPGFLEAVMSDRADDLSDDDRRARSAAAASMVPLGREGRYREIADAILFLASEDAAYVTGTVLTVDGGITLA